MSLKDLHKKTAQIITDLSDRSEQKSTYTYAQLFIDAHLDQIKSNAAYRNFSSLSKTTEIITTKDLPAIPTDAFKLEQRLNPSSLTPEEIKTTFLTSGTTTETKGKHHFSTTSTYETSILSSWKYCNLPKLNQTFILTPSPTEAPHSSLSHMMGTIKKELTPSAKFILSHGQLDHQHIIECAKNGTPVTLLGTALAFLQLFEILANLPSFTLPPGSWALETGGYKGTDKSLTKEQLYQLFQTHLAIPPDQIWNEYSMTELSSQFYTKGIGNPHTAPPWTYIKVIDPETNLHVKPGQTGYLIIYDLANVDSVIGIRTQDLAVYHTPHSFTLISRDPSALPRGCSRSL